MFKYIIVIFLFFCRSLYAQEELFTCTDIDSGGFYYNGSEYQLTLFNLGQFDMKIDFENNSLQSDSPNMFFAEPNLLDNSENLAYMTCASRYGETFMINRMNLEFTYSAIFGHVGDGPSDSCYADSIGVRFGICKKV